MGNKTFVQDKNTGAYSYINTLARKENVNIQLLEYINTGNNLNSVMKVNGLETLRRKRGRVLTIDLSNTYSIQNRLTKPISGEELILLIKDIKDGLADIADHEVSINYVELNLDRIFINEDGAVKFIIWGTTVPENTGSVLDLFYDISTQAKAKTRTDEKAIDSYKALFEAQRDTPGYIADINRFVEVQYQSLEEHILSVHEDKGDEIEGKTDANTVSEINRLNNQIKSLRSDNETLNDEISGLLSEKQQNIPTQVQPTQTSIQTPGVNIAELVKQQVQEALQNIGLEAQDSEPEQAYVPEPAYVPEHMAQSDASNEPEVEDEDTATDTNEVVADADEAPIEEETSETTVLGAETYTDAQRTAIEERLAKEQQAFLNSDETEVLADDSYDDLKAVLTNTKTLDTIEIKPGNSRVGKNRATSDIFINKQTVSNSHATINYERNSETIAIVDDSTNGTYVNGVRIPRGIERIASSGDIITFADEEFKLEIK